MMKWSARGATARRPLWCQLRDRSELHEWAIHFTARSVEPLEAVVEPKCSRSLAQLTGRFAPHAVSKGVRKCLQWLPCLACLHVGTPTQAAPSRGSGAPGRLVVKWIATYRFMIDKMLSMPLQARW